jgi:uncharacterized protein YggL (DUF469 family)
MKFMVSWRVHDEHRHDALKAFSEMTDEEARAEFGDSIEVIGRWHDLIGLTGVAIIESDDAAAVSNWLLGWNSILDVEVTPVFDDDETRAIGKARG